jgi:cardiolipin synthase
VNWIAFLTALIGLAFVTWLVFVALFTPRVDYRLSASLPVDCDDFLHVIEATCQAAIHHQNQVTVLTNAVRFYAAMRDAILQARSSVHLEAYIFQPGDAATLLTDAMVDRARAGVEVRLVLDAIGSSDLRGAPLERLTTAGCHVQFYQPPTWYRWHRLNNRTHRELLVVDGRLAFTGGAGVADWWITTVDGKPSWRDTMVRIEGPVVAALQGVFAENWLECGGEVLTSAHLWPSLSAAGPTEAMLVKSSPADRATSSRVVFQMLIEGARETIDISTPYFLPDRALRGALCRAARGGVAIRVIVPGPLTDQRLVRLASRRLYGEVLEAGVRIYEYRPAMTHVKAMMVDHMWAIVGTTNVDNRSFEHNDEVNVAFRDRAVADTLRADFDVDLTACDEITLDAWRTRPWLEKLIWPFGWILERQQ